MTESADADANAAQRQDGHLPMHKDVQCHLRWLRPVMFVAMLLLSVAALSCRAFEDADGMRYGYRGFMKESTCQPWKTYEYQGGSITHEYSRESYQVVFIMGSIGVAFGWITWCALLGLLPCKLTACGGIALYVYIIIAAIAVNLGTCDNIPPLSSGGLCDDNHRKQVGTTLSIIATVLLFISSILFCCLVSLDRVVSDDDEEGVTGGATHT